MARYLDPPFLPFGTDDEDLFLQNTMCYPGWWDDINSASKVFWSLGSNGQDPESWDVDPVLGTDFAGVAMQILQLAADSGSLDYSDLDSGFQLTFEVPWQAVAMPDTSEILSGGDDPSGTDIGMLQIRSGSGASNQSFRKTDATGGNMEWQGGQTGSRHKFSVHGFGKTGYVTVQIGYASRAGSNGGYCWVSIDDALQKADYVDDVGSNLFNELYLGGLYQGNSLFNRRMRNLQIVARPPVYRVVPALNKVLMFGDSYVTQTSQTSPFFATVPAFSCRDYLSKRGFTYGELYAVNSGSVGDRSVIAGASIMDSDPPADDDFSWWLGDVIADQQPSAVIFRGGTNDTVSDSSVYVEGGVFETELKARMNEIISNHHNPQSLIIVVGTVPSMRASYGTEEEYRNAADRPGTIDNVPAINKIIRSLPYWDHGTAARIIVADIYAAWGGEDCYKIDTLTQHQLYYETGGEYGAENDIHPAHAGYLLMGERYGAALFAGLIDSTFTGVV